MPGDYVQRMRRAIVGIEVRLTRVEAKATMSQNKGPADVRGIVDGLRVAAGDDAAVLTATWMAENSLPAAERRDTLIEGLASACRPR